MTSTTETLRDIFADNGRGLQHQGLRRNNERAVLSVVGFGNGVSNADIARVSGLAPQTVSAILTTLDRMGLIMRGDVLRGRRGQPATPIFLRAEGAFAVGIEIGLRHTEVLLLNFHAEVITRQRRTYCHPNINTLVADVAEMVSQVRWGITAAEQDRVIGMGLALPTMLIEQMQHAAISEAERALWQTIDLAGELERAVGLPTTVFNDGNAACWAELIASPQPRPGNFIYLMVSHTIAAGIVGGGALWEGPGTNSANLGAMLVEDGTGQWQPANQIASLTALLAQLEQGGHQLDVAEIAHWDWDSFGPILDRWIETAARAIARVAYNTIAVIESRLLVIDGVMPDTITQRLVDAVDRHLKEMPTPLRLSIAVMRGHLGAMAPAIGAAELPLFRRYLSRSLLDLTS